MKAVLRLMTSSEGKRTQSDEWYSWWLRLFSARAVGDAALIAQPSVPHVMKLQKLGSIRNGIYSNEAPSKRLIIWNLPPPPSPPV